MALLLEPMRSFIGGIGLDIGSFLAVGFRARDGAINRLFFGIALCAC